MRNTYKAIFFLKSFATGVLTPVLALMLLAHGATFATLSLLLGVYSLTVIVAEFPSGLFADLYGRKKTFLLSVALSLISCALLLFSHSFAGVLCAIVANGLGRAFSSGSLDALAIDEAVESDAGSLAKVTGQLNMLESAGLAVGAIAGGLLAGVGTGYAGNLIANLCIYPVLMLLTALCVRERPRARKESGVANNPMRQFVRQARESFGFLAQRGAVRMLFLLAFVTGFALLSVETYWQPAFTAMADASWGLGAVSCIGFAAVILGSKCAQRLLLRWPHHGEAVLLALKALFGVGLIALFFASHPLLFAVVYMIAYFFLGNGSVAESTLLNCAAPSDGRAGILSLFSLVLQIGGLFASLCGFFVSEWVGYRYLWLIAGTGLITTAGVCFIARGAARVRPGPAAEGRAAGPSCPQNNPAGDRPRAIFPASRR